MQACLLTMVCAALISFTVNAADPELRPPNCGDTTRIPHVVGSSPPSLPTTTAALRDHCGGSSHPVAKHLVAVAAKDTSNNYQWLSQDLEVPFLVYFDNFANNTEAPVYHSYIRGAREAGTYLTFIAEHYDCLPEVTLFAHAHQTSWHSIHSLRSNVRHVRWDKVPGFAIMHQRGIWRDAFVKNTSRNLGSARVKVPDAKCSEVLNNTVYWRQGIEKYAEGDAMAWLWDTLFTREGLGEMPEKNKASKGAEFFVTRDRITARPRSFYLKLLQLIHDNPLQLNVYDLGVVYENTWHIIFGEPAFLEGLTIAECDLYDCEAQALESHRHKNRRLLFKKE